VSSPWEAWLSLIHSIPPNIFRSSTTSQIPQFPFIWMTVRNWEDDTQWDSVLPHFRGSPVIGPRSYPIITLSWFECFPRNGGRITTGTGRMTFSGLRHGTKS
jgi:hypothetical protein